ncbi:transposase [Novosphingobium chloroacetimidivorans]|uniref:Transposase n=1 Tax=Novosphingobium chloroacetimidivorans TaxID=1428314 RepID=A0A7W7KDL3_9SPHN|nr:transposase [Novosphingobium chloroacetimidivorans]
MSVTDVHSPRWCDHRYCLPDCGGRPRQLQPITLGQCLVRSDHQALPGEVDYDGHISRRGDTHVRSLLYEAAVVILTRSHADSDLRSWGMKLREKIGFKRAAVAVARKLAVIMHAMLRSGDLFTRTAAAA